MNKKSVIILSIILISILALFSVSGTYAKYTSQIDLTDEARVAVWDVNIEHSIDLFKDSYLLGDEDGVAPAKSLNCKEIDGKEVCDKIVAPGTKGEYKFKIEGKPEVRYKISFLFDDKTRDDIGRIKYWFDDEGPFLDLSELQWNIEEAYSDEYEPNTPIKNDVHTIRWEWDFEDKEDMVTYDKIDTSLGEQAINDYNDTNYDKQKKVIISFKILVEQVTGEENAKANFNN